jgi:hypothetical protein
MTPLPTDLEILNAIYERYYVDFRDFEKQKPPPRRAKIYVPVDCEEIARQLRVDGDIVFGRLYYHMDQKYSYRQADGHARVSFFTRDLEPGRDVINFPLMSSVLAGLRADQGRHDRNTWLSVSAIIVAFIAALISMFAA